jgi:hypothetical protein
MQEDTQRAAAELEALAQDVARLTEAWQIPSEVGWVSQPAMKEMGPATSAGPKAEGTGAGSATTDWLGSSVAPALQNASGLTGAGSSSWWSSLVSPLAGGVMSLFGGTDSSASGGEAALPEFALPSARLYNLGFGARSRGFPPSNATQRASFELKPEMVRQEQAAWWWK